MVLNTTLFSFSGYTGSGNQADFGTSGALPSSVAASGGAESVTLTFSPTAVGAATITFSITNDDADENPYDFVLMGTGVANTTPTITSNASVSAAENSTGTIATVTATDPDAPAFQTLAFSITGGAHAAAFSIDSATGELSFADPDAIDFENPSDTGGTAGDNVYEVTVQVSDGTAAVTDLPP